jgi:hypothetical protein
VAELSDELKRSVWQRDGYRCQECGVAVAGKNGCLPQTHHIKPRSAGGTDDPENLTTLCLCCHATKDSAGHAKIFSNCSPNETPSYIKALLWEISTNLVVFAENLPCREFPAPQVLDQIKQVQGALESVRKLTLDAIQENPRSAENIGSLPYEMPETLDAIVQGFKLSYWSRHREEVLNEEVRGHVQGA